MNNKKIRLLLNMEGKKIKSFQKLILAKVKNYGLH